MLIDQMITIVSYIHSKKFILKNISPNNFCIGLDKNAHKLYIVSLGSAKRYIQKNGQHIPYIEGKRFIGSQRFASINAHLGV